MDNFRVHSQKKVKRFPRRRHPNIKGRSMPPYSPWLDPQGYLWDYLRRKLPNDRFFMSSRQMAFAMARSAKSVSLEEVMGVCSLAPLRKTLKAGYRITFEDCYKFFLKGCLCNISLYPLQPYFLLARISSAFCIQEFHSFLL